MAYDPNTQKIDDLAADGSGSIANVGVAAGIVDGDSLHTTMSYDATGTTFLISEVRF